MQSGSDGKIKKIGVLTSGGDAPGMNAVIRAVVRTAIYNDIKVTGFKKGYEGLLNGDFLELTPRSVSDIIHRGGTILLTARCEEMMTEEGRKKAANIYHVLGLDALVIIGGDGSLAGGELLSGLGINVIGIPGTIDLDFSCSDYTIGFDTAVNTGMEAINRIRDTSTSHERVSVVEVMGRGAGHIALWCGLTGGAEEILIPENPHVDKDSVVKQILENRSKGRMHNLVVVAEGIGSAPELAAHIQEVTGIQTRATILGHLQRGGAPTALDRMHASMMGYEAVRAVMDGVKNSVIVFKHGTYKHIDINEALNTQGQYDNKMYEVIKMLAI